VSLAEKFKEYRDKHFNLVLPPSLEKQLERAFYAGAEAMDKISSYDEQMEALAEIDHFRSHK